jgi:hypothetical protein
MTGALVLSGDPTLALHPVTKQYVEANYPSTARTITAGTGLSGGGTLAADRTISVAAGGISATELASDAVTTVKILNDAVTTAKIADNQITNAKMADNSVDSAEIVAGAVDPSHLSQKRTYGTAQATTSGTSAKSFTSIPSWAKRVVVMFNNVSLSSTDDILVQIGDSGGLETSSYVTSCSNSFTGATSTTGFLVKLTNAAFAMSGTVTLDNIDGNTWVATTCGATNNATAAVIGGGVKTLSDVLDRVSVLISGANSWDSGSVNIFYE